MGAGMSKGLDSEGEAPRRSDHFRRMGVVELRPPENNSSRYSGRLRSFKAAAQDVNQRLDRKFDEEKRLGDEIVSAAHGGIGPAFEIVQAGDKNDGRLFVCAGSMRSFAHSSKPFMPGMSTSRKIRSNGPSVSI